MRSNFCNCPDPVCDSYGRFHRNTVDEIGQHSCIYARPRTEVSESGRSHVDAIEDMYGDSIKILVSITRVIYFQALTKLLLSPCEMLRRQATEQSANLVLDPRMLESSQHLSAWGQTGIRRTGISRLPPKVFQKKTSYEHLSANWPNPTCVFATIAARDLELAS